MDEPAQERLCLCSPKPLGCGAKKPETTEVVTTNEEND
jgi:hypothetical protein